MAAVIWITGARLSGPVAIRRAGGRSPGVLEITIPILVGALLFGAFFGAKLIADQIPLVSGSIANVLNRADAGPRPLVLAVALINGVGEEMFFRGALYSVFARKSALVATTVTYCVVTVATLNVALVAAALAVGAVFVAERRLSGGVLAPLLTHVTWSLLVILLLPR